MIIGPLLGLALLIAFALLLCLIVFAIVFVAIVLVIAVVGLRRPLALIGWPGRGRPRRLGCVG